MNSITKPVNEWTKKDFLIYFSSTYTQVFKSPYKITFISDYGNLNKFYNKFTTNEQRKEFIDYCFSHKGTLIAQYNDFSLKNFPALLKKFEKNAELWN